MKSDPAPGTRVRFGTFEADLSSGELRRDGLKVKIQELPFQVLVSLLERHGEVVTREDLRNRLWPADTFVDFDQGLNKAINKLREALGDDANNPRFVETMPRRGYRFIYPVTAVSLAGTSPDGLGTGLKPTPAMASQKESGAERDSSDTQMVTALVSHHKGKLIAAGLFIAALLIVGGYAVYRIMRPAERAAAPPSTANLQFTQITTSGTVEDAAISPDGRYVAYVESEPGGRSLWLHQIVTGSTVRIVPPAAGLRCSHPAFTPGGNYVDYLLGPENRLESPALYRVPVLGGPATRLLEDVDTSVALSPDGKRMAFVRDLLPASGKTQLVIANADGSNAHAVATRERPEEFWPFVGDGAWSPDGKVIAVSAGTLAPTFELFPVAIDTSSGREQQIGSSRWFYVLQLAWLPDGRSLLMAASEFSSPDRRQIWQLSYPEGKVSRITNDPNNYVGVSVTKDGSTFATVQSRANSNIWIGAKGEWDRPHQVTQGLSNTDGTSGLSWTTDGKIVYTSAANGILSLWQVNPGNGDTRKLVQKERPTNAPSGCGGSGYLTFVTATEGEGPHIWRTDADGSGLKQLTHGAFELLPSCSPDGKWVVYPSASSGRAQLWKVSIDGGKPVQLTRGRGTATRPRVSPDGKWIAFHHQKNPQSPPEYAIMPFAGGKLVKTFPVAPTYQRGGNRPIWMPNGPAFADIVWENGVSNIVAHPIDGGPTRQLTHYDSGHNYQFDISRDGRLALARGTQSSDVVLITNFH
jgi:Tol biopolymer transport system component/DNA-binding winged helix-turn-helix (wHTH) protein